jgi:hypothetical protein
MEGCRLLDEWSELATQRLRRDVTVEPSNRAESGALAAIADVLPHLDRGTVADAARATRLARTLLISPVRLLLHAGILCESDPHITRSEAAPLVPTDRNTIGVDVDPTELLTQGREAFRRGDLQLAEQLWVRALGQQPNDRVLAQNLRVVRQRLAAST